MIDRYIAERFYQVLKETSELLGQTSKFEEVTGHLRVVFVHSVICKPLQCLNVLLLILNVSCKHTEIICLITRCDMIQYKLCMLLTHTDGDKSLFDDQWYFVHFPSVALERSFVLCPPLNCKHT